MSNTYKSTDIVLILPPKRFKEHRYSLGLLYVSGYLRDHGYDNTIIETKFLGGQNYQYDGQQSKSDVVAAAIDLKPKIVGFTASTIEIAEVVWMNQQIKSRLKVWSIIGGPHATAAPKDLLEAGFDAVVIGEGEATAVELVGELSKDNPDLSQIRGIAWRRGNETIINPPRDPIDISTLSLPAYDKIYMQHYARVWDDVIRGFPMRAVMVMASRGCPYNCTFCACNKVFGRQVRYRSAENIKAEIEILKNNYGVEGIWFADDTLTVSYEHVKKICQLMKDLKMYWGAQSRVDLTNEEIVKLMKESGCLQLDFGVESGNQRVLDEVINKRIKLADVVRAFELCKKYHIRTQASFMIGLPTETKAEMEDTFSFAKKIKPDYYSFNVFTPLPGTALYDKFFKDEVNLSDYSEVSFHHSKDKFNKSGVKDIENMYQDWRKKLFEGVKWRSLIHPVLFIAIFLKLGNKKERLEFITFKFRRAAKYLLNKLGFNFSLR